MDVLETFGMKVTKATLQRIIKEELSRVLQEQIGHKIVDDSVTAEDAEGLPFKFPPGGLDLDNPPNQQPDKYPAWFDSEFDLWWDERDDDPDAGGADWRPGLPPDHPDQWGGQDDVKKFAWMAFRMWLDKQDKVPPVAKTPAGGMGHSMASDLTAGFADVGFTVGSGLWTEDGYINWTTGDPNPQHSNPNRDWYKKTSEDEDIVAEIIRRLI